MQPTSLPIALSRLHDASEEKERDSAWTDFVEAYSDVVLHGCRGTTRDPDEVMDAYAFVLQALRESHCRRLRAYVPDGKTKFTTWLIVVVRRLTLDHIRQRYGRSRSEDVDKREAHSARRRLEDLVAENVDPDQLAGAADSPEAGLRRADLAAALRRALEELDARDRLLLALRFEDGRSVREIARALGMPTVFHAYRRLGSVLDALRLALARRGVEGPEP